MTQRQAERRRRVTICDPVKGLVSPNDIKAYLVATGWKLHASGYFDLVKGRRGHFETIRYPEDDYPAKELEYFIDSLAFVYRCAPSAVLRAIEAHARGEKAVEPPATRRRRKR